MINRCSREVEFLGPYRKNLWVSTALHLSKGSHRLSDVRNVHVGKKSGGRSSLWKKDLTTIQVHEETSGLLSWRRSGCFRKRGPATRARNLNNILMNRASLKRFPTGGALYHPRCQRGSSDGEKMADPSDRGSETNSMAGDIIAEVPETPTIVHKCMVLPDSDRNCPVSWSRMVTIPSTRLW